MLLTHVSLASLKISSRFLSLKPVLCGLPWAREARWQYYLYPCPAARLYMGNIGWFHGRRPQLMIILLLFHRDLQEEVWRWAYGEAGRAVCQADQDRVPSLWGATSHALLLAGTAGQWVGPFLSHIPANPGCQNGYLGTPGFPQGFFSVALQKADIGVGTLSHSETFDDKHLGFSISLCLDLTRHLG